MELLDQYLKTIKTFLPRAQQDDIIRELSENLLSQMEDREAELGRPLTESEQETILQHHGNPMVVAGRYQQLTRNVAFGRQLISPVLFPLYIKILSLNLGLTTVAVLAIGFAMGHGFALSALLLHGFLQFAIITFIFTLVEAYLLRFPNQWNPRDFGLRPKGTDTAPDSWLEAFSRHIIGYAGPQVTRSEAIAFIILNLIFALWWIAVPYYLLHKVLGPSAAILKLGPGCEVVYLPILALAVAGMVQPAINLFRPQWTRFRAAWRTASAAVFVAILCFSLKTGSWAVLADPSDKAVQHQRAIETVNYGCRIGLTVGAIICTLIFLLELRRLLHRPNNHELTAPRADGMQLS